MYPIDLTFLSLHTFKTLILIYLYYTQTKPRGSSKNRFKSRTCRRGACSKCSSQYHYSVTEGLLWYAMTPKWSLGPRQVITALHWNVIIEDRPALSWSDATCQPPALWALIILTSCMRCCPHPAQSLHLPVSTGWQESLWEPRGSVGLMVTSARSLAGWKSSGWGF